MSSFSASFAKRKASSILIASASATVPVPAPVNNESCRLVLALAFFVCVEVMSVLLRLCHRCGCPTTNYPAVCDGCKAKAPELKRDNNRRYDSKLRDPRADAFYHSAAWKNTRLLYLASVGYLCEDCVAEAARGERNDDDVCVATDVHHRVPLLVDWGLRLEWSNLQGLCDAHHKGKRTEKT